MVGRRLFGFWRMVRTGGYMARTSRRDAPVSVRSKKDIQIDSARYSELDRLANTLDSKWRIPGTGIRFGVDAVAGLIPGVGDAAAAVISGYLILQAARLGVPRSTLARMVGNVAVDTVFGSIPILGSVFDIFFKANNRNIKLVREAAGRDKSQPPRS
ncbi:hypothetical protein GCM10007989_03370 [Devosia pacifica]|uniref:DUF4112 domain-containing protein n=2 Tax=Devosia pacifica TaxID=1335967 RepID=A0A918RVB4_9HYPH|nr:hypothetical protein GCM10007989_03370 [Devosia pacifica]